MTVVAHCCDTFFFYITSTAYFKTTNHSIASPTRSVSPSLPLPSESFSFSLSPSFPPSLTSRSFSHTETCVHERDRERERGAGRERKRDPSIVFPYDIYGDIFEPSPYYDFFHNSLYILRVCGKKTLPRATEGHGHMITMLNNDEFRCVTNVCAPEQWRTATEPLLRPKKSCFQLGL